MTRPGTDALWVVGLAVLLLLSYSAIAIATVVIMDWLF